jgi:predicted outer membrane repeat protein
MLAVTNSTFSGNSGAEGGAIYSQATLTVSDSTFSGNSTSGFGGGIYNDTGGTAIANNNVFSGNTALLGAGIQNSNTANSSNNVFHNNLSGGSESDCSDCTTNSNAIDGDPKLALLGNYGGTTATMLPLPGSAAICAGSYALAVNAQSAPLTTDERGFVMDSLCVDAGAVQTNYLMVTNTQDDGGARSLRGVLAQANSNSGGDVAFDPALFSSPQTITLGSALPAVVGTLNLEGPGAADVTVSGGNAVPVFSVNSTGYVNLSGVTLANGVSTAAGQGGAITNNGTLVLSNSAILGSNSATGGGGVANAGNLTVNGSLLSGNSTAGCGGAIYSSSDQDTVMVQNSTFAGNLAMGDGGAICGGGITVDDSTFSGNTATATNGGDIVYNATGTATLNNTIVVGGLEAPSRA